MRLICLFDSATVTVPGRVAADDSDLVVRLPADVLDLRQRLLLGECLLACVAVRGDPGCEQACETGRHDDEDDHRDDGLDQREAALVEGEASPSRDDSSQSARHLHLRSRSRHLAVRAVPRPGDIPRNPSNERARLRCLLAVSTAVEAAKAAVGSSPARPGGAVTHRRLPLARATLRRARRARDVPGLGQEAGSSLITRCATRRSGRPRPRRSYVAAVGQAQPERQASELRAGRHVERRPAPLAGRVDRERHRAEARRRRAHRDRPARARATRRGVA